MHYSRRGRIQIIADVMHNPQLLRMLPRHGNFDISVSKGERPRGWFSGRGGSIAPSGKGGRLRRERRGWFSRSKGL
jgi:hypothetical protein